MPHLPSTQWPAPRRRGWRPGWGLLAAVLAAPLPPSVATPALVGPDTQADIQAACAAAREAGDTALLRQQQEQLRGQLRPALSLDAVLGVAEALLACGAPQAALAALTRISPAPGASRRRWLLLQWRAAHAGLHHAQAARALRLLAGGDLGTLETLQLPVGQPSSPDQPPPQRAALDVLADHLVSLGQVNGAAEVLLASREPGVASAARWGRAAALARGLPLQERDAIVELALEQAAAAQAWGLVATLLDQQLAAGVSDPASEQALQRRLRLGARIDDVYGEWLQRRRQLRAGNPADPRLLQLEGQLRSPREPGGHAHPRPASPFTPSPAQP